MTVGHVDGLRPQVLELGLSSLREGGRVSCAGPPRLDTWPFLWLFSEPHQERAGPSLCFLQASQESVESGEKLFLLLLLMAFGLNPEPSRFGLQFSRDK